MSQPPPPASPGGSPPYRELVTVSLLMGLGGWALIALLVFLATPTLGPRWAFFFALFIALVGTSLPLVWYLNRRFSPDPFPGLGVLWRESVEVGIWGLFLIWLRVGRLLTPFTAWTLTGAFFAVELLLRLYERSRWVPSAAPGPATPVPETPSAVVARPGDSPFTPPFLDDDEPGSDEPSA
jgi:hypothetical protein